MKPFVGGAAAFAIAALVCTSPVFAHGRGRGHAGRANVEHVQQKLQDAGYDPGSIDGRFGPRTRAALKSFQRANDLEASGRLDRQTLSALGIEHERVTSGMRGRESHPKTDKGMQDMRRPEDLPGVPSKPGGEDRPY